MDPLVPLALVLAHLKENPDHKLTEYVLLGTLTSIASTLILSLLIRQVMTLA